MLPFGIDPVFLIAAPLFVAHAITKQRQVEAARAASMRRHPSSR